MDTPNEFPKEVHSSLEKFGKTSKTKHHIIEALRKHYKKGTDYIVEVRKNCHYYHVTDSCYKALLCRMNKRERQEFCVIVELVKEENLEIIEEEDIKKKYLSGNFENVYVFINEPEDFRKITKWVDIFTNKEIIEVKRADEWKDAIGQVLAAHVFFKELNPRIHLFTIVNDRKTGTYKRKKSQEMVEIVCKKLNIKVTWYDLLTDE